MPCHHGSGIHLVAQADLEFAAMVLGPGIPG